MLANTSPINNLRRFWRTPALVRRTQFLLDIFVLVGAFALAYLLRFDFAIPAKEVQPAMVQLTYVVLLQFTLLLVTGIHTFIWRYIGMAEVKAFIAAALWSALPVVIIRMSLPDSYRMWRVPLSVIMIDMVLAFGGLLGVRVLRRADYERGEKRRKAVSARSDGSIESKPVLLIGAGRAGMLTVKEIQNGAGVGLDVKGFVDDDPHKQGAVINGVRVLGRTADVPQLIAKYNIDHVIISIAQSAREDFRRILDICESIPVKVRVIPAMHDILQGKVKISRIRDVQIEDLLGREPVRLDQAEMRSFLAGRVVMVTGAGGSIGSELARQVAQFGPANLLLVERAEFALFNIERELRETFPALTITSVVADIGDESRMRAVLAAARPHVLLHAAAHKHVPMMEMNPAEAVKNNVLATRLLGGLAGEFGVEAFVLISTDKAVRPRSVMGATKRVAELVVQDLNRCYPTRFVAVRFGNVIGSTGSVIPIFREQIQKGGPVTVTDPNMMRYFMTIPEAAQLVLQAGAMGEGGEIFTLDMGEPVRILDLAKATITLSGLRPFEDIDIVFTGSRPGEKMFEQLETTEERVAKTRHPKIFISKIASLPDNQIRRALLELTVSVEDGRERELCELLNNILPEADLETVARKGETGKEEACGTLR